MKHFMKWLFNPPVNGPKEIIILRIMAGLVFFWEGLIKFVFVNQGVGRFTKLGFPMPETTAHLVATFEIIGGLMLVAGFMTRAISFYFFFQMIVAILSTKISLWMGTYPLALPPAPPVTGFWAVLHEVRSDFAQVLTCLFLMLVGPGLKSVDRMVAERRN